MRTFQAALVLVVLAAMVAPGVAAAHAQFVRSEPAFGANLASAPTRVTAWFSEELASDSRLTVIDQKGQRVDDGRTVVSVSDPKSMSVGLKPIGAGAYLVRWEAVSLEDKDVEQGTFSFAVSGTGGQGVLAQVSLAISIAALLLALLALLRSKRRAT